MGSSSGRIISKCLSYTTLHVEGGEEQRSVEFDRTGIGGWQEAEVTCWSYGRGSGGVGGMRNTSSFSLLLWSGLKACWQCTEARSRIHSNSNELLNSGCDTGHHTCVLQSEGEREILSASSARAAADGKKRIRRQRYIISHIWSRLTAFAIWGWKETHDDTSQQHRNTCVVSARIQASTVFSVVWKYVLISGFDTN